MDSLDNLYLAIAVNSRFCFVGGAAGGGYSQVIPMEEVCLDLFCLVWVRGRKERFLLDQVFNSFRKVNEFFKYCSRYLALSKYLFVYLTVSLRLNLELLFDFF